MTADSNHALSLTHVPPTMTLPILFPVLLSLFSTPQTRSALDTADHPAPSMCPAEMAGTRDLVLRFLTTARYSEPRTESGIPTIDPANLHLLSDEEDAGECTRLNDVFGYDGRDREWVWTYYKVESRYVVSVRWAESVSGKRLGFMPLYVFDESFDPVAGYAM